ncbi:hypothetical protein ACFQH2_07665 [Natronoarchaeum sp. GCM10025703]|uniref:hypothetical protein n=1 Tax=Natronoarchaeum sp. GCM10025703 TaxID=3252685 RepID=UPI00360B281B
MTVVKFDDVLVDQIAVFGGVGVLEVPLDDVRATAASEENYRLDGVLVLVVVFFFVLVFLVVIVPIGPF